MAAQIADIERIRQILGVDKITLIGHSFGAFMAALYATEFPDHIQSLVLVSPAEMLVQPAGIRRPVPAHTRAATASPSEQDSTPFSRSIMDFNKIFSKSESDLAALNDRMGDYFQEAYGKTIPVEQGQSGGWMVWAMYIDLGPHHDYRSAMTSTAFPVQIIHGADDLQPEKASRTYLEIYPKAQFEVIPGAGHFSFEEQPAAFAKAVGDFLTAQ